MNFIKAAVAAGIAALAIPAVAGADDLSYSYVDLGWVQTDIDGVSSKADGFALRGSVGFAENFFVFADYSDQSISSVDFETYSVGLGGHWALSDNVDFVGKLGWAKAEASFGGASLDDDGYLASIGLRGRVEQFELEGHVVHTDFGGSSGDSTGVSLAARWHFNKNFAVGVGYDHSDDVSMFSAGVRFSF